MNEENDNHSERHEEDPRTRLMRKIAMEEMMIKAVKQEPIRPRSIELIDESTARIEQYRKQLRAIENGN